MFEIGEYVVYGSQGVCQIADITRPDIAGIDGERLYYVLTPIGDANGRIYAPTENQKTVMRRVISKEEAEELIRELPAIKLLFVPNEKQREIVYKEALRACDYHAWVSIAKTLYVRKKERTAQGRKSTALDEKYMRAVEHELYSELSLALGIPQEQMEQYIRDKLQETEVCV